MIGQAAISNPWIFRQSKYFLEKGVHEEEPQVSERVDVCIEHLRLSVERKGEIYGVKEFRKHYSGYLRGLRDVSKFRLELMQFNDFEPLAERLRRFKEEYKEISEVQNTI